MKLIYMILELPIQIVIWFINLGQQLRSKKCTFYDNIFYINLDEKETKKKIYIRNALILFYINAFACLSNRFFPFDYFYLNLVSLDVVIVVSYYSVEKFLDYLYKVKLKLPVGNIRETFDNKYIQTVFSFFTTIFGSIIALLYILCIYNLELINFTPTTVFGYILMFIAVIFAFIGYFAFINLLLLIYSISMSANEFAQNNYDVTFNDSLYCMNEISKCFKFLNGKFLFLGLLLSTQYIFLSWGKIDFNNIWFIVSYVIIVIFVLFGFVFFNILGTSLYNTMYKNIKNGFLSKYFDTYTEEDNKEKKEDAFNLYNFVYSIGSDNEISLLYKICSAGVSIITLVVNIYPIYSNNAFAFLSSVNTMFIYFV